MGVIDPFPKRQPRRAATRAAKVNSEGQSSFTLWPWKVLAVAVPALALCAMLLTLHAGRSSREIIQICFSLIAAGNAVLIATAIGDLGRSVIAVPVGAFAGLLAVQIFSYPAADLIFFVLLAVLVFSDMASARMTSMAGLVLIGALAVAGLVLLVSSSRSSPGSPTGEFLGSRGPEYSLYGGYPFVLACVAASMPTEFSRDAIIRAALSGLRAALHGIVAGIVACMIFARFASATPFLLRSSEQFFILPLGIATMTMNYFAVQYIFGVLHRAAPAQALVASDAAQSNHETPGEERRPNRGGL